MALQFEINAVTPFRQNCTLIWDDETKEAVLTDVGGDVPYLLLEEGETLKVGNHSFQVLHIPGHTPGQVVFYNAENELLVAGDVLFYETVGRTDFPRGNHDDLINNICAKLLTLPETTQVIAGHGRMTSIGHEKRYNPFLVR